MPAATRTWAAAVGATAVALAVLTTALGAEKPYTVEVGARVLVDVNPPACGVGP